MLSAAARNQQRRDGMVDDPELGPIAARGSPTADAVEALGIAAAAIVRRFGPGLVGLAGGLRADRLAGALALTPTILVIAIIDLSPPPRCSRRQGDGRHAPAR